LPPDLAGRVFTVKEAAAYGLSREVLRGRRFRAVQQSVFRYADSELTLEMAVKAALYVLPPDAALSHVSNMQWRGIEVGPKWPVHFSTNTELRCIRSGIELHRRRGLLHVTADRGVPILGPDRTFVDASTQLSLRDVVRTGDALLRLEMTNLATLGAYLDRSHINGVRRARRLMGLLRERVDSFKETDVRLLLAFARLPEPVPNTDIFDRAGGFIAHGDLVYAEFKVLVEYDGWLHERTALKRSKDHQRRELLDGEGWRVIVVTAEDFKRPEQIVIRVHEALRERGYRGAAPVLSTMWRHWFG